MTRITDGIDELAALFLTGPDDPVALAQGMGPGGSAREVELVLVGHLPVRAGVWLAPYVDAMARRVGPAVVVRLDDTAPYLQLFRGSASASTSVRQEQTFRGCVESLAPSTRLWAVRAPADAELADLVAAGPDRITILSGADEVAVCAAYRLIKSIWSAAEAIQRPMPPLGLAVLGCSETAAQAIVTNLNRTTSSFLDVAVSLVLALPQVDAGAVGAAGRRFAGERCPSTSQLMHWIADAPRIPRPVIEPEPTVAEAGDEGQPQYDAELRYETEPRREVEAEAVPPAKVVTSRPAPAAPVPISTEPAARDGATMAGEPPLAWTDRRTMRLMPKPAVDIEPKTGCQVTEPDADGRPIPLASHVAGLRTLPIRCPNHEQVELALDTGGRLHLLGQEPTFRQMHVVSRWAVDHRELLSMALPDHRIDAKTSPRLHLFTEQPVSVSDLHASDVQLHVLAPVKVGTETGWFAAPLNQASH